MQEMRCSAQFQHQLYPNSRAGFLFDRFTDPGDSECLHITRAECTSPLGQVTALEWMGVINRIRIRGTIQRIDFTDPSGMLAIVLGTINDVISGLAPILASETIGGMMRVLCS